MTREPEVRRESLLDCPQCLPAEIIRRFTVGCRPGGLKPVELVCVLGDRYTMRRCSGSRAIPIASRTDPRYGRRCSVPGRDNAVGWREPDRYLGPHYDRRRTRLAGVRSSRGHCGRSKRIGG
jgi:hypothetical protein